MAVGILSTTIDRDTPSLLYYIGTEETPMDSLSHIFVNFSKRKMTLVDDEGYEKDVQWRFDDEGAEGFSETISEVQEIIDNNMITYCFAVK